MRRYAARIAPALLTFLIGVGASHLWQIVTLWHTPGRSPSDHGIGRERGKLLHHAGGIPGQYIVVLDGNIHRESVAAIAAELIRAHGGQVQFVYRSALKGFSVVRMPEEAAVAISHDPRVSYVESDVQGKLD
jgi:hypothetical protein